MSKLASTDIYIQLMEARKQHVSVYFTT